MDMTGLHSLDAMLKGVANYTTFEAFEFILCSLLLIYDLYNATAGYFMGYTVYL